MVGLGETGYLELAEPIVRSADELRATVDEIPELRRFGDSPFMVAFGSDELDVWHLNDALQERGWRMNGCQKPDGLHFCVTRPNTAPGVMEQFAEGPARRGRLRQGPARRPGQERRAVRRRRRRPGAGRPDGRLPRRDDDPRARGVSGPR